MKASAKIQRTVSLRDAERHFHATFDQIPVGIAHVDSERRIMLAWNETDKTGEYDFPIRAYTDRLGLGQVLGYVSYPKKDDKGYFFRTDYLGRTGVELTYDDVLKGENGSKVVEVDALGHSVSEYEINLPKNGKELHLSIDAGLSEAMYQIIASSSAKAHFRSGAAAIMDVKTGELLALTSFPSYDPEIMADGDDVKKIDEYECQADHRTTVAPSPIGPAEP